MEGKDKKYLFISQRGEIQRFTNDSDGYLKEKSENLSIPNVGIDTRLAVFENAVYEKIKIHYRLEKAEVTLNEKIEETLQKLIVDSRVTIHFDASGRPREHVFFNKEDEETHFYFDKLTEKSGTDLKYKIENIAGGPLSIFNEIYVSEGLLRQNSLLKLVFETDLSRVVTDSASIERRKDELDVEILTPEERKTEEDKRRKAEGDAFISRGESGNFVSLQKTWQQTDLSLFEQIVACQKFQATYPNSQNRILIESKLQGFQDKEAWEKADNTKTMDAYLDYLIQFKEGSFKDAAKRCILNLETGYKNAVEPLKQKFKAATSEIERLKGDIETHEEKANGFGKKAKLLMAGIFMALLLGTGGGFFMSKSKTSAVVAENPLRKRVDALIETRIYPKQQQLVQDSKGVVAGSDEVYELLKVQENLNKALFDCHKVQFDLLPQLEANKMAASEVEKEINRIENAIK